MLLDNVRTHTKFTPVYPIFTPILGCRGVTGTPPHLQTIYNLIQCDKMSNLIL